MSYMTFNFSSTNGKVDKSGKFMMNGFNSHILAPVGAIAPFEERFDDEFTNAIVNYPTITEVNDQVNAVQDALLSGIENLEETKLSSEDFPTELGKPGSAAVIESYGTFATNSQLGQYYGMTLNSTTEDVTYLTGFEIGQLTNTSNNNTTNESFFRIAADNFIVGASMPTGVGSDTTFATMTDAFGDYVPAFSISVNDDDGSYMLNFNGSAIFENLVKNNGQTIIDGGKVSIFGTTTIPINFGHFATTPTQLELDEASGIDGYQLTAGDEYHDNSYTYKWDAVGNAWVSAEKEVNALESRLGSVAYVNLVEKAKLGSTIIEGGYLKTELIEAGTIIAGSVDASNITGTTITGKTITGSSIIGSSGHFTSLIPGSPFSGGSALFGDATSGSGVAGKGPTGVWGQSTNTSTSSGIGVRGYGYHGVYGVAQNASGFGIYSSGNMKTTGRLYIGSTDYFYFNGTKLCMHTLGSDYSVAGGGI